MFLFFNIYIFCFYCVFLYFYPTFSKLTGADHIKGNTPQFVMRAFSGLFLRVAWLLRCTVVDDDACPVWPFWSRTVSAIWQEGGPSTWGSYALQPKRLHFYLTSQ